MSKAYAKNKCKTKSVTMVTRYLGLTKEKLKINSFFAAQFNHCPLIWIIHSRFDNNTVKSLRERCL